jgi:hypothetical protein
LAQAYYIRGVAYLKKGEYSLAKADFARARQLDPTIKLPELLK